jgi:hypothetical protein
MRGCFLQLCPNGLDYGVNFLQHLIVPKSEDPKTSFAQSLIAHTIMLIVVVLAAIHLNNQLFFQAHKVDHKIQEWMLTAEFETCNLPATQALPQAKLGIGHMAAQSALERIVDDRMVCLPLHLSILFLPGYPIPSPPRPSNRKRRMRPSP